MPDDKVTVTGLVEAQEKITQVIDDLRGQEFREGMQEATLLVTRTAREIVPVVTGRLKNSILPDLAVKDDVVTGIVGSNVTYAPAVELGLGGRKPRYFLRDAMNTNRDKIHSILNARVHLIVEKKDK